MKHLHLLALELHSKHSANGMFVSSFGLLQRRTPPQMAMQPLTTKPVQSQESLLQLLVAMMRLTWKIWVAELCLVKLPAPVRKHHSSQSQRRLLPGKC